MEDLPIEWFLRDGFQEKLFEQGSLIARLTLKIGFDYVNNFDELYNCIDTFLPLDDLTSEELSYAVAYVQAICSYESMVGKGLMRHTGEGYELTNKGRKCKQMLKTKPST